MDQSDKSDPEPGEHSEAKTTDPGRSLHKMPLSMTQLHWDPDSDVDEVDSDLGEQCHTTPVVEDYSLADGNIPPDRTLVTRALLLVGNDGETRLRGCTYYTIFGNCRKGVNYANADGHTPEAQCVLDLG